MTEESLSLVQKLANIRSMSDVVVKTKSGYNYKYADLPTVLANITAGMKKYGVSLIPMICPGTASVSQNVIINSKVDKTGKPFETRTTEMLFCAEMIFRWVNDDNPEEYLDVPWYTTGSMTDPAQSMSASMTYTLRRFLVAYFQIAEEDTDVDAYRSKQKAAEEAEGKEIAAAVIKQFDTVVRSYMADHPDDGDKVRRFVSKYVKDGLYQKIKNPDIAGKLLADFREEFKVKE